MLISLNQLNKYVDISDLSPEHIAEQLTQLGLEVEACTKLEGFDPKLVVGEITEASKHPNADSLRLCTVDIGAATPLQIVCGAPNARVGIKVAVAQIGAVLPENFKIKASKIRGIESHGMLCSEQELGLSAEHAGILELPASAVLGTSLTKLLNSADTVLEVAVSPNRGDCLSYIGIARDLAAGLKSKASTGAPERNKREVAYIGPVATEAKHKPSQAPVKVHIKASEECARFVALHLELPAQGVSPLWLKQSLSRAGMRSINLLVDLGNYVMLERGQPLHCYDAGSISGSSLVVRTAHTGEELQALDGNILKLVAGDLLICDAQKPVALAGIMGGKNSEVKADTKSLILEVAHFSPSSIRNTAKRLALRTEAAQRFERGIDIDQLAAVALRFYELLKLCLQEQGLGTVELGPLTGLYPEPRKPSIIALRLSRIRAVTGLMHLRADTCASILHDLGFKLLDKTEERMLFEVPTHRNDILREVDLIEEVLRVYGYDKVPSELPRMNITPKPEDPLIDLSARLKMFFAQAGLSETMHFPFTGESAYEKLGLKTEHPLWPKLKLNNALNEEQALLQSTLLPGLLEALAYNRHRGRKGSQLFEMARTYFDREVPLGSTSTAPYYSRFWRFERHLNKLARAETKRPLERLVLCGALDQPYHKKTWQDAELATGFFHAKELLASLCKTFGLAHLVMVEKLEALDQELVFLHPGQAAYLTANKVPLGWLGVLHPDVSKAYELDGESPVLFEIDVEAFFELCGQKKAIDAQAWRFPAVTRDLALALDIGQSFAELEQTIYTCPQKKHLQSVALFDVYSGEQMPQGKKSMATSLRFQSRERTLTDKDVDKEFQAIVAHVQKQLGATQR